MNCPNCKIEMEFLEETYCNFNSNRVKKGQHTGNIYRCNNCDQDYLDDFLDEKLKEWDWSL